ncbi:MAG: TolC family protein [Candidatus Goldbacteria bacterium]|nr:TolC family protein [Candidatus Goldiibacteriota bacterium]
MYKRIFFVLFMICIFNFSLNAQDNINQKITGTAETIIDFSYALKESISKSSSINQALFDYYKSKAVVEKTYGMFDLLLSGSVAYTDSKAYPTSLLSPEETKVLVYKASLANKLFTGGFLSLDFSSTKTDILYQNISIPGFSPSLFTGAINPSYKPVLSLTYTQPLLKDFWGRPDEKAIKIGELSVKLAKENLKKAILDNVTNLKELYLFYYMAEKMLQIQNDFFSDAEKLYKETVQLKSLGLREETDILQARASMLSAKAELEPAANQVKLARENFLNVAGFKQDEWDKITLKIEEINEDVYIPELTEELENLLVDLSPQVVIVKCSLDMAKTGKEIADNSALPSLNLIGSYGIEGFGANLNDSFDILTDNKYRNFMIGANFSWSFPNRAGSGEAKSKDEEYKKALEQYDFLRNQTKIMIRNAYRTLVTAKNNYEMKKEARQLTEKRLNLQKKNFSQGRISLRELIMTQTDFNQARIKEVTSYVDYIKAVSQWNKISGKYDGYFNEYIMGKE